MTTAPNLPKDQFGDVLRRLRRRSGLSQLDLALRSGTTQRYVSFLENGRAAPGRDIVRRLAVALAVSSEQEGLLFIAAGYVPDGSGAAADDAVLSIVGRILRQQEPFPALLLDAAQNILDANDSVARLLAFAEAEGGLDLSAVPGRPNLLRLFFHEAGLFPFVLDPGRFTAAVLGRVLREARGDSEALAIVSEVADYPHVRRLASRGEAPPASPVIAERYRIGSAEFGLTCLVTSVGVPGSAEAERLRIEQFHPADDASEGFIRKIVGA